MGGKEDARNAVEVGRRQGDGGVHQVQLKEVVGVVLRTDVRLAAEGRNGDGVLVDDRQVVAAAAVNVGDAVELGRHQARPEGNEAGALDGLGDRTKKWEKMKRMKEGEGMDEEEGTS